MTCNHLAVAWPSHTTTSDETAKRTHARLTPTVEQVQWITARDRIGEAIDLYLSTEPPPPLLHALRTLEGDLAHVDRAAGL